MSTYEGEHTIFGLLGQANLTQNDVLQSLMDFLNLVMDYGLLVCLLHFERMSHSTDFYGKA
jgi:hypothetical protein